MFTANISPCYMCWVLIPAMRSVCSMARVFTMHIRCETPDAKIFPLLELHLTVTQINCYSCTLE